MKLEDLIEPGQVIRNEPVIMQGELFMSENTLNKLYTSIGKVNIRGVEYEVVLHNRLKSVVFGRPGVRSCDKKSGLRVLDQFMI